LKKNLRDELEDASERLGSFKRVDFVEAFEDLHLGANVEPTRQLLAHVFQKADPSNQGEVSWHALSDMFLRSNKLLRAFIRSRVFTGIMDIHAGSVQVVCKRGEAHEGQDGNMSLFSAQLRPESRESTPVKSFQIDAWRKQLRDDMEIKKFPENERGLFVGISVFAAAAEAAGVAGRLLPKEYCLTKMEQKLFKDAMANSSSSEEQVNIANLAFVIEVVERVLHKDSWLSFQQTWQLATDRVAATWAFGWYVEGEPECEACGGGVGSKGVPLEDLAKPLPWVCPTPRASPPAGKRITIPE